MERTSLTALASLAALAVGCAEARPLPAAAPPTPPAAPVALVVRGEIGGMNEEAVAKAFGALERAVTRCVVAGAGEVGEIGGHFEIALRIDPEGKARWAYVGASTLGHRTTEKCIADAARGHAWPRPVGGDGLARRAFDLEPGELPIAWDERRVRGTLRRAERSFGQCKRGLTGEFVVTAYVRPDGRVVASGVAPPSERGEDAADCVAKAVQGLRFASPGRKTAKLTFALR